MMLQKNFVQKYKQQSRKTKYGELFTFKNVIHSISLGQKRKNRNYFFVQSLKNFLQTATF